MLNNSEVSRHCGSACPQVRKAQNRTEATTLNFWFKGRSDSATYGGYLYLHTQQSFRAFALRQRAKVTRQQQRIASQQATQNLIRLWHYRRAQHIALYHPIHKELSPLPLCQHAWRHNKKLYLPQIHLKQNPAFILNTTMTFRPYRSGYRIGKELRINRFGIPEPFLDPAIHYYQLDAVICPLTAFDRSGNRIGMGGGYYDRYFKNPLNRPALLGFAYHWQEVEAIPRNTWDIQLDGVITDREIISIRHSHHHD